MLLHDNSQPNFPLTSLLYTPQQLSPLDISTKHVHTKITSQLLFQCQPINNP